MKVIKRLAKSAKTMTANLIQSLQDKLLVERVQKNVMYYLFPNLMRPYLQPPSFTDLFEHRLRSNFFHKGWFAGYPNELQSKNRQTITTMPRDQTPKRQNQLSPKSLGIGVITRSSLLPPYPHPLFRQ